MNTLTFPAPLLVGSMRECYFGVEGGKAFAEALPKSSLTSLKCAAAHVLAFCVQRPLTFLHFSCTRPVVRGSLSANALKDEGCKAVAAVLPQTQIKELKCAPATATARQHLPPCAHLSAPHELLHFCCT